MIATAPFIESQTQPRGSMQLKQRANTWRVTKQQLVAGNTGCMYFDV